MSEMYTGQSLDPEYVVVCVDGPNADNQAAALGALTAFSNEKVQLAAVVVSGTAVDYRPNAPLGSRDDRLSQQVQEMHTARMAGLFKRAGSDVPVFIGKPVATTAITTPIPHNAHVRHADYDIFGDNTGLGCKAIAGNFNDLLTHLAGLSDKVHVAVGGSFTEVAEFLMRPDIVSKLGYLAAQAGFEVSERAIYSKLSFNVEMDMLAALKVLLFYPDKMFNVPSDITRAPEATFRNAEELIRLGVHPEIGDIFIRHRARAEERHKQEQRQREAEGKPFRPYPALSIHDLQAVMALQQALGLDRGVFTFGEIDVERAIQNMIDVSRMHEAEGRPAIITPQIVESLGYLGGSQTIKGPIADRYVVTAQNVRLYKRKVPWLLRRRE